MTVDAWITLLVLVATIALLATERLPPASSIPGAVLVLLLLGVIDGTEALAGFSNPAPVTVAALYVLAGAFEATGALDRMSESILGRRPKEGGNQVGSRREIARLPVGRPFRVHSQHPPGRHGRSQDPELGPQDRTLTV